MSPQCLPPSFSLIQPRFREQMSFQDSQDGHHGGHLGYWNGTNLALLNLHATPMPPMVWAKSDIAFGADMVWRFSRWPACNSESQCCSDASHQVYVQSDLRFGSGCSMNIFKMVERRPSWISEWYDFSNSKSSCSLNAPHQVWAQSDRVRERMWFQDFQDGRPGGRLG